MMPKHVAKGLPKGLTDRMPGKASAARLATAMTTALTTAAAVLCIKGRRNKERERNGKQKTDMAIHSRPPANQESRSEEHTSELQSLAYLVCRLLLEKKNKHN